MNYWIGTSGWQYKEWKGDFYPEKISPAKMLPFYADRFSSTESNYTFRHLPSEKSIATWSAETPDTFRFSFKAPQRITHFSKLRDCADSVSFFANAIAPMKAKAGAVLFQLPPTFQKDVPLLVDFLATLPKTMRAAFEFRHASWFSDDVYSELQMRKAALCIAQNEDLSTPPIATAPFGYLRLRRLDYDKALIAKWAEFIKSQGNAWSDAFIYFKHEETGVGPTFARQMQIALNVSPKKTH